MIIACCCLPLFESCRALQAVGASHLNPHCCCTGSNNTEQTGTWVPLQPKFHRCFYLLKKAIITQIRWTIFPFWLCIYQPFAPFALNVGTCCCDSCTASLGRSCSPGRTDCLKHSWCNRCGHTHHAKVTAATHVKHHAHWWIMAA